MISAGSVWQSMKLFLDTNIVLDYLEAREKGLFAKQVLKLAKDGKEWECVTASSVTDILYLLTKALRESNKGLDEAQRRTNKEIRQIAAEQMDKLLNVIHILTVTEDGVKKALALKWADTEDALQYVVAKANSVDIIITNNIGDYELSDIPVMDAEEFLRHRE